MASLQALPIINSSTPLSQDVPLRASVPSYASLLSRETIDTSINTGSLYHHGAVVCVKIDESVYKKHVQLCQESLIGRVILIKGEKLWKFEDLYKRLSFTWKPVGKWCMVSLGKGYYNFHFDLASDRDRIWSMGS